ncbi:MAG: hypothetical protein QGI29_05615, partial [Pirellulales bacterium]|nr:hypothetical protein [Pirellulales bacterium]
MNQMTRSRLAALLIISVVAFSDGIALADTASDYETIFGAEAKKVAASETKTDDTAFAAKLLKASEEMPDSPTLQILLYEKACQFGSASPAGCETALEALGLLEKAAPDKKDQWRQWKFDIVKLRYDKSLGSAKKAAGKPYMEMLEILADTHMSEGKGAEAEKLYSHAIMVARYIKSDRAETILAKSKRANAIAAQQVKLSSLQTRLTTNPKDTTIREELVLFYVVELDKPAEAVKLLTDGLDEATRTYVPLAAKKLNGLDEAICLELGDWYYLKLSKEASAIGKPVVLRRSDGYYRQFLEFHKAKDAQSYRVKTALKSIEKELSKLDLGETLIVESNTTDNSTKHQTEALPRQADELDATEEEPGVSRVLAVLNRMPKSLLPDSKDGWDKLTMPKVNEWLAKYSKKKPFRGQLAFKSCAVRHIKGNTYSTSV